MNRYRRYNARLSALVIMLAISICAINIITDPFGIWKLWNIKSINSFKPEQETHERLYKAIDIINLKPSIIFIGTSRVLYGLDPNYYSKIHQETTYNAAVSSANMHEILYFFKHALKNQPSLKQVVVGVDFYSFNVYMPTSVDFPSNQMEKDHILFENFLKTVGSLDAIKSSYRTVATNISNKSFNLYEYNGKASEINLQNTYGKANDLKSFTRISAVNINNKEHYARYEVSQDRIREFRELVDICRDKGIDVKVFISPSHVTDMEAIRVSGKWEDFEYIKRQLCAIIPIWDFSGYNSITTEPISKERQYYWDGSHYKKDVGNMILSQINGIKGNSPSNFGVIISQENIENHLASIREARREWANNNPEIVSYIQSLKKADI